MKLVNFASLDPAITATGRVGLRGASKLDREIWNEFHADWERLSVESEHLRQRLVRKQTRVKKSVLAEADDTALPVLRILLVQHGK